MLPFELQVLETAIGDVCALCSQLVKELEANSHPALDALTKHVKSASLVGASACDVATCHAAFQGIRSWVDGCSLQLRTAALGAMVPCHWTDLAKRCWRCWEV